MPRLRSMLEGWLAGSSPPPPIARLLEMTLRSCADGVCEMDMQVGEAHHNPMGTVHGGIFCDLADAAMGSALASLLEPNETFTTVELAAHYFAAVQHGLLQAHAKVLRKGRTTAYVECEIREGAERLVGKFSSTCLIRRMAQASEA